MTCAEFRSMAESYIAGELPVDTNHEMIAHLEVCPECLTELETRARLRKSLRAAFERSETLTPDPAFVAALRGRVLAHAAPRRGRFVAMRKWLPVAAAILLIVFGVQFGLIERLRDGSPHLRTLGVDAVGDHRDCALEHRLAEAPISLEEAARRYNAAYAGLRQVVDQSEPVRRGEIEVVAAHWCVREGRSFAHIVVRRAGRIVSLLLTPVDRSLAPQSDVDRCPSVDGFTVACFDAPGHAGFVVSELGDADNLNIARELAPALRAYLARA
jgi:anti-sigma factor RsiW